MKNKTFNISMLDVSNIKQELFTGINTVDKFNEKILKLIKSYEIEFHVQTSSIFDIIEAGDITGYLISKMTWRKCSAYLVIQTSNIGYRYLCYFYDHEHHTGAGTSYNMVEYKEIINEFKKQIDKIKNEVNLDKYPKLKQSILNPDYNNFGIY